MSEHEDSSNNLLLPPSPSIPPVTSSDTSVPSDIHSVTQVHNRDTKFYFRDGSAVFLVGNKLFKFQASLLAADSHTTDYEFKHIMKYALDGFEGGADNPGADDAHPIVLPADVTEGQFRDLLMVAFGGVANNTFLTFLRSLRTPSCFNPLLVSRLTNVGYLGCRFGMSRLDTWSQVQLQGLLHNLVVSRRSTDNWDAQVILRLVQYLQSTTIAKFRHKMLALIRHIISALVRETYKLHEEIPQGKIIDVCVALYKEKDILINSPTFFGLIFAIIVSLGHQSPGWTDILTREDRRVLYAANATFTRLSNHTDIKVGWVMDPTAVKKVCPQCSSNFDACWSIGFSQCEGLKSRVPSEDIRHIVSLPEYQMDFWSTSRAASCKCADTVVDNIELCLDSLYRGLTEKYKVLVETI